VDCAPVQRYESKRHGTTSSALIDTRMGNLTTLAPDIVEAILEDALPDHLTLFDLASDTLPCWGE
jgi:hypothetical protein